MQAYKNYVAVILNRINTITGVRYSADPTIFAWELANEPRTSKGYDALMGVPHGSVVKAWVSEMAAYFRSLDPNHMARPFSLGCQIWLACYQQAPSMQCPPRNSHADHTGSSVPQYICTSMGLAGPPCMLWTCVTCTTAPQFKSGAHACALLSSATTVPLAERHGQ
jgi:hypothetical protein